MNNPQVLMKYRITTITTPPNWEPADEFDLPAEAEKSIDTAQLDKKSDWLDYSQALTILRGLNRQATDNCQKGRYALVAFDPENETWHLIQAKKANLLDPTTQPESTPIG
jgi:hypothetical protein